MQLHQLVGRPWAVTAEIAEHARRILEAERGFAEIRRGLAFHAAWDREEREDAEARSSSASRRGGDVAVIPIIGLLTHRGDAIDSEVTTSTARIADDVRAAAADRTAQAIVLEVDSPGGEIAGIPEAAEAIREARAVKPIIAIANTYAASAAYWLASQADEVLGTPSGMLGSVGVYWGHVDYSREMDAVGRKVTYVYAGKYKIEGNPYEPLAGEALAAIQAEVDYAYAMFTADVARGRGVPVDAVRNGFGEGRALNSKKAVAERMADGVGDLDDAIRRAAALAAERRRGASALAPAQAMKHRRAR